MSKVISDTNFESGALRSAEVDDFDFASAPLIGLLGVLKVCGSGGIKYGRHNYTKGMPVHVTLNHVAIHLIRYLLGDRSEDHLSKVAWGAMVANQTALLQPELASPFLLGPGATLTAAMCAELDRDKEERDAKRAAGEFDELCNWTLGDIPQVKDLLHKRQVMKAVAELQQAMLEEQAILDGPTETAEPEPVAEVIKVKRKRRTKAQIAAELAAEEASQSAANSAGLADTDPARHITLLVGAVEPAGGADEEGAWDESDRKTSFAGQRGDHMGGCPPAPVMIF